jgi:hypothetical protein
MFPQDISGPTTGNQPTTSSIVQQNNSLLGNPQFQATQATPPNISSIANSTAPGSSTTDPHVAAIVKALKGTA